MTKHYVVRYRYKDGDPYTTFWETTGALSEHADEMIANGVVWYEWYVCQCGDPISHDKYSDVKGTHGL